MSKVRIISIFDKHEDFIKLQYESIVNHVEGDYEYIIFNNASDELQAIQNKKMCEKLNIKCIRIHVNYNLDPSNIAGSALNEAFSYFSDELVFKIDSDMFFTSNINISKIFETSDLIYIPNYVENMEIMWSGVFGLNMKKIDMPLNFKPNVIPKTDTFGQSSILTKNSKYTKKLFKLYCIQSITNDVVISSLNNDCGIHIKNNEIILNEKPEYYSDRETLVNLNNKILDILNVMKLYEFPSPYNIDMIEIDGVDFMFHFKSSNWCPWYTDEYVTTKKDSLIKYLKNN